MGTQTCAGEGGHSEAVGAPSTRAPDGSHTQDMTRPADNTTAVHLQGSLWCIQYHKEATLKDDTPGNLKI